MKEFLKKYLSEEEITKLEDAYKAANPEAKGLPVYISKARLDEVLAKQHAAESERDTLKTENETLKQGNQQAIEKAVKEAQEAAKAAQDVALAEQKKDFDITEEIYKLQGKNVIAIKALMDKSKDYKAELKRIQEDAPYLFSQKTDDLPDGTGKKGDKDSNAENELTRMRQAVGVI